MNRTSRGAGRPASTVRPASGSSRRGAFAAAGLGVLGATGALVAGAQPWLQAQVRVAPGTPPLVVAAIGRDLAPALAVLGLVGLAGAGALLLVTGWGRRVVGGLVSLAGAGMVVAVVSGLNGLVAQGGQIAARGNPGALVAGSATPTAWPWVGLGAGLVLAAAGALAVWGARRWPGLSARYERPAPRRAGPALATDHAAPSHGGDNVAVWDALDAGHDPTG